MNNEQYISLQHEFEPIFDNNSKILILGTIPSEKSREIGFYYSHPRNRFWKILSDILCEIQPVTIKEKKQFLINHNIALWDVLQSCRIRNSSDLSITNPIANDLSIILKSAPIKAVFTTGKKATELYTKYCINEQNHFAPIYLPSTSPANCAVKYADILDAYRTILLYMD